MTKRTTRTRATKKRKTSASSMRTKTFGTGKLACRTYIKSVGAGYEVGCKHKGNVLFIAHFVKSSEANFWYNQMNREIRKFAQAHKVGDKFPAATMLNLLANRLTKRYCVYHQKLLAKHEREAARKERVGQRRYKQLNKRWTPSEKRPLFKAA